MTKRSPIQSFEWISAEPTGPIIYIDKYLRIYFNRDTQKMFFNGDNRQVFIGYDRANHRFIVGSTELVKPVNVEPFTFDKRGYTSARPFLRAFGLTERNLPRRYVYLGRDHSDVPSGAHVFGLDNKFGEDGGR